MTTPPTPSFLETIGMLAFLIIVALSFVGIVRLCK